MQRVIYWGDNKWEEGVVSSGSPEPVSEAGGQSVAHRTAVVVPLGRNQPGLHGGLTSGLKRADQEDESLTEG